MEPSNIAPISSSLAEAVLQVWIGSHGYEGLRCQFCGRPFYRPRNLTAPRLCIFCRQGDLRSS